MTLIAKHYDGLVYEKKNRISYFFRLDSKEILLIFFHGSIQPCTKTSEGTPLPCFRGYNFQMKPQPSILSFSDALLEQYKKDGLFLSWYLDSKKVQQRREIQDIISSIIEKYQYKTIIFHGSSGGGHIAIDMASRFHEVALVANIQTDLVLHSNWRDLSKIMEKVGDEIVLTDIGENFSKGKLPKKIIAFCNTADSTYKHHKYLEKLIDKYAQDVFEGIYFDGREMARQKGVRAHSIQYPNGEKLRGVLEDLLKKQEMKLKNFKQLLINEYDNKANLKKIKRLSTNQSFKERIFGAGELGDKEFYIKKTFVKSKFCYTLFESKNLSFWSISSLIPYFTVIPAEKLILIWKEEFKKEISLINQFSMKSEISNNLDSSKPLMIYLSYGRPGHFFEHMNYYYTFFGKDKIQPDIAIVMNETFFDFSILEQIRGMNVLKFENDDALNQYCIAHKRGVQKIMRTEIKELLEADDWCKKYNGVPHPEFYRIPEYAFVLWINICSEKRVWKEKEETIIKLIREFSNLKNHVCVILDGMTRTSYMTREQFLFNSKSAQIDNEFVEKIKSVFLDTDIQFINSVGFSSGEKMYLADRVNFFITGYWTDSIYVAKFARAFGIAFGSKASFKGSFVCFHPNTMMMPSEYVTDIGSPVQNYTTIGYSINPDDFIDFVKKALVNFESISERKIIFDGKGFIKNYNNAKRFYSLRSSMKHKSSYLTIAEKFAPFSINTDTSYNIESNIEYHFTANGFSKNNSIVLIIAYDEYRKRIFAEKLKFLETKSIIFPNEAITFRIFIKLMPQDEIKFYGIRWVTQNESSDPWFSIRHKMLVQSTNKLLPNIPVLQIKSSGGIPPSPTPNTTMQGSAKDRIHNHLAYKLGSAMILNSKSLWGYIRMPYVLSYIKESHKKEILDYETRITKNPSLKLPKLESYPDYKEALKEKECFTYKLGEALMQADKNWYKGGYLRFYFKEVPRLKREFREKTQTYKKGD